MARITIDLPVNSLFTSQTDVRISDINYGNHLSNDKYLALMHEVRLRFLKSLGYPDELRAEGVALLVADSALVYKREVFHGDVLDIELFAGDFSRCGFDFYYKMSRLSDGAEVARGKTGMVCTDFLGTKKICALPEILKEHLTSLPF